MSKPLSLFYFVLGVAFAHITEPYAQQAWYYGYDKLCGGSMSLAKGKAMMTKAIETNDPTLFAMARTELEKSASCKTGGEASFLLGLQYCNGMGVEKSVRRGRELFRDAVSLEPKWSLDIISYPRLCEIDK